MARIPISMIIMAFLFTVFVSCGSGGGSGSDSNSEISDLNTDLNCPDNDGDGYSDANCGGLDCDDTNPKINPVVRDICGDNTDQNCDGRDRACSGGAAVHAGLTWDGSAGVCLSCHIDEAEDMYRSTHYQWKGDALYMTHGPQKQGKIDGVCQ